MSGGGDGNGLGLERGDDLGLVDLLQVLGGLGVDLTGLASTLDLDEVFDGLRLPRLDDVTLGVHRSERCGPRTGADCSRALLRNHGQPHARGRGDRRPDRATEQRASKPALA